MEYIKKTWADIQDISNAHAWEESSSGFSFQSTSAIPGGVSGASSPHLDQIQTESRASWPKLAGQQDEI